MIRTITIFVVFTIAATTPVQDDAPNKLTEAVGTKNTLHNKQIMENKIPKGSSLKNMYDVYSELKEDMDVSFKSIEDSDDDINKINSSKIEDLNHLDEGPIKKSDDYMNDPDEDLNDNFIDIDHRNKSESKLSTFVTILVEFIKSIAEQIISIYKR